MSIINQELCDLCKSLRVVIEDKFSVLRMAGDEEWVYGVVKEKCLGKWRRKRSQSAVQSTS